VTSTWSESPSDASVDLPSALRALAHAPAVELEDFFERIRRLPRGTVIDGTFVIDRELGSGGMGVVYLAHHEALDRQVAIKLCLRRSSERHTDLLLREARAMAALVHPNVAAVHHVGTTAEQVYIAMEYVPGGTLRAWLAAAARPWPEIVAMFVQAGRGLAAAHDKGFVHRDFKPDNVLIGEDGRARVTDFGLAVNTRLGSESGSAVVTADGETSTTRGAGTPRYMAPEQRAGRALGPAADQYAFCLALHEALYGALPGEPSTRSRPAGLPRAVESAIARGLRGAPQERHPDMHALLHTLERRRSAGRWFAITGVVAAIGGASWFAARPHDPCPDGEARLAQVWSPARRSALTTAMAQGAGPNAATAGQLVGAGLDAYADAWRRAHATACDVALLPDDTRRVAAHECLDEALVHFDESIGALSQGNAAIAEQALTALYGLPRLVHCTEPAHLDLRVQQRGTPEAAAAIAQVRRDLARVRALESSGSIEDGWRLATDAVERATALGDRALLSEALLRAGRISSFRDAAPHETAAAFERAYLEAEVSGADEVRAEAGALLVYYIGVELGRHLDALDWARRTEAVVERLGELGVFEAMSLHDSVGRVHAARGDLDAAEAALRRAESLELETHGADHPSTSSTRLALGEVLMRAGRYDESAAALERAWAGYARSVGADHPSMTDVIIAEAALDEERGDDAAAETRLGLALHRREAEYGLEDSRLVQPLNALGRVRSRSGHHDAALAAYGRARRLCEQQRGDAHIDTAWALVNEADALVAAGRSHRAREVYDDALTIMLAQPQPTAELEVAPLLGRAEASVDTADPIALDAAWSDAERVRSTCARVGCSPAIEGRLGFVRARLLVARQQPDAGVALARETLAALRGERRTIRALRDAISTWLASAETSERRDRDGLSDADVDVDRAPRTR
jgi:tetratricopeptide (TPR) repeat protein